MVPHIPTAFLRAALGGILLTVFVGAITSGIWAIRKCLRGEILLPETPIVERRRPPWGLATIALILVVYIAAAQQAFQRFSATDAGKPAVPPAAPAQPARGRPVASAAGDSVAAVRHQSSPLELMSIQGAINGIFLILLPLLARLTSGARLRDLGVSLRRWQSQVAVGIVAVLVLMPVVYAVQAACVILFDLPDMERESYKHPLEKMIRENFSPGVALLAIVSAVVLAPAFEELLFRGLIQPWLVKAFDQIPGWTRQRPTTSGPSETVAEVAPIPAPLPSLTPADAMAFPLSPDQQPTHPPALETPNEAVFHRDSDDPTPERAQPHLPDPLEPVWDEDGPSAVADRIDASRLRHRSAGTAPAIIVTSALFAALHAAQWPAPIPLFVLAVGLGVVFQRTGSLLSPICMHAFFNAFSTLMLFFAILESPAKEKVSTPPIMERLTPSEKATPAVPDDGQVAGRGKS